MLPSLPLACQTSALLMSYAPNGNGAGERNRTVVSALARPHSAVEPHPRNGVPSRTLTSNLTLRTRPLCALSYGDKNQTPGRSLSPAHTQHFLEALGRLSYFAFRSSKWYARPVTLRTPALISSAIPLIRQTALFELRAQVKRLAECRGLAPHSPFREPTV